VDPHHEDPAAAYGAVTSTPVVADDGSRDAAAAFARQWVEALNVAYQTLDSRELQALSAPECMTCQAYIKSMSNAKAAGERWEGGLATVRTAVAAPIADHATDVLVNYDSTAFFVQEASGARSNEQAAEKNATVQVSLKRVGDSWITVEVAQL